MKLLVISNCTSGKVAEATTARELYRGRTHRLVRSAIDGLRDAGHEVDWRIVSAKHGVIDELDVIEPYSETFTYLSPSARRALGSKLEIPQQLRDEIVSGDHDRAYVVLTSPYLTAAAMPYTLVKHRAVRVHYIANGTWANQHPTAKVIRCGEHERAQLGVGRFFIVAEMFAVIAKQIVLPSAV